MLSLQGFFPLCICYGLRWSPGSRLSCWFQDYKAAASVFTANTVKWQLCENPSASVAIDCPKGSIGGASSQGQKNTSVCAAGGLKHGCEAESRPCLRAAIRDRAEVVTHGELTLEPWPIRQGYSASLYVPTPALPAGGRSLELLCWALGEKTAAAFCPSVGQRDSALWTHGA